MRWNTRFLAMGTEGAVPAPVPPLGQRPYQKAATLLLFVAGMSLVAAQLVRIAISSLRRPRKVPRGNISNQSRPPQALTEEDRIEIAAEHKEWK